MSNEEFILLIVNEKNFNLNVKRMSTQEFILSIVNELKMNLNVKERSKKEFILSIVKGDQNKKSHFQFLLILEYYISLPPYMYLISTNTFWDVTKQIEPFNLDKNIIF